MLLLYEHVVPDLELQLKVGVSQGQSGPPLVPRVADGVASSGERRAYGMGVGSNCGVGRAVVGHCSEPGVPSAQGGLVQVVLVLVVMLLLLLLQARGEHGEGWRRGATVGVGGMDRRRVVRHIELRAGVLMLESVLP
jgi:hypothetical protein